MNAEIVNLDPYNPTRFKTCDIVKCLLDRRKTTYYMHSRWPTFGRVSFLVLIMLICG